MVLKLICCACNSIKTKVTQRAKKLYYCIFICRKQTTYNKTAIYHSIVILKNLRQFPTLTRNSQDGR